MFRNITVQPYIAAVCVQSKRVCTGTLSVCILWGLGIISYISENKVFPCTQPASFHIPQESCNLFLPAHLPSNNPWCFLPFVLLLAQKCRNGGYQCNIRKKRGSPLQSLVGGDGMKSEHSFFAESAVPVSSFILQTSCLLSQIFSTKPSACPPFDWSFTSPSSCY